MALLSLNAQGPCNIPVLFSTQVSVPFLPAPLFDGTFTVQTEMGTQLEQMRMESPTLA